jgi:hypothetical protein
VGTSNALKRIVVVDWKGSVISGIVIIWCTASITSRKCAIKCLE